MVRIRLRRTGAKNNPAYRIVVADVRAPRDGDFIEIIGHYLPTRQPHVVEINEEKAREWIRKGAQPSDTAASLLRQKGILNAQNKSSGPGASTDAAPVAAVAVATPAPVAAEPVAAVAAPEPVAAAEPAAAEPVETAAIAEPVASEEPVETAV